MPFDPFFQHRPKDKPGWYLKQQVMAGKHGKGWPEGSKYAKKVRLQMRPAPRGKEVDKDGWWTFLEGSDEHAKDELRLWAQQNPDTEFRIAP